MRSYRSRARSGTIFLQLECVSPDYRIEDPRSPDLIRYVLFQRPELHRILHEATALVYPEGPAGYHDASPIRILWNWVAFPGDHPEVWTAPDRAPIRERLGELLDLMDRAWEARPWEVEVFPEAPDQLRGWRRRRYRVVTFSLRRPMAAHRAVIDAALPGAGILMVPVGRPSPGSLRAELLRQVPEEPARTLVVLDAENQGRAGEWRERQVRTVMVDRTWTPRPHFLPGRSLYVPSLGELDPTLELQREYF